MDSIEHAPENRDPDKRLKDAKQLADTAINIVNILVLQNPDLHYELLKYVEEQLQLKLTLTPEQIKQPVRLSDQAAEKISEIQEKIPTPDEVLQALSCFDKEDSTSYEEVAKLVTREVFRFLFTNYRHQGCISSQSQYKRFCRAWKELAPLLDALNIITLQDLVQNHSHLENLIAQKYEEGYRYINSLRKSIEHLQAIRTGRFTYLPYLHNQVVSRYQEMEDEGCEAKVKAYMSQIEIITTEQLRTKVEEAFQNPGHVVNYLDSEGTRYIIDIMLTMKKKTPSMISKFMNFIQICYRTQLESEISRNTIHKMFEDGFATKFHNTKQVGPAQVQRLQYIREYILNAMREAANVQ